MANLLKVNPIQAFSDNFHVPSSKPETQRAILTGALAEGESRVANDLRSGETETMKQACRALGAHIVNHDGYLEIYGVGRSFRHNGRVIRAEGSGLVLRTMIALATAHSAPVVLTGNARLCERVLQPLLGALRDLGAQIECIGTEGMAPVVSGGGLKGGSCRLPGDVSSQFITAVLFAAPLAESPVEIEVTGELYSRSYLRQTVSALARAGVDVSVSADYRYFRVTPSRYRAVNVTVRGDFTSASYLLAAAALYPGRSVLRNVAADSEQGEFAIIEIIRRLGVQLTFDRAMSALVVDNHPGSLRGDFQIDARDCPNIVPTLAALGAYVDGTLRVVGGRLTRFHKASRIEAVTSELANAGVDIRPLFADGVCDGFEVRGAATYPGGRTFSSWGDHRIFMSLFVAGLRMSSPNTFTGFEDVHLSFPEFFAQFAHAGVEQLLVTGGADSDALHDTDGDDARRQTSKQALVPFQVVSTSGPSVQPGHEVSPSR